MTPRRALRWCGGPGRRLGPKTHWRRDRKIVDARWPVESKFTPPVLARRHIERAGILQQPLTTERRSFLQQPIFVGREGPYDRPATVRAQRIASRCDHPGDYQWKAARHGRRDGDRAGAHLHEPGRL